MFGIVNGKKCNSRDEFIYESRGFGPIESDAELIAYAQKVTGDWYYAGHSMSFSTFYLSDFEEPRASLTNLEFTRLRTLQAAAIAIKKAEDLAREWKKVGSCQYVDDGVEEIWEDKYGNRKTVQVAPAHADP